MEFTLSVKAPADAATRFARIYDDEMDAATRQSAEVMLKTVEDEIINRNLVAEEDLLRSIEVVEIDVTSDLRYAVVGTDDIAANVAEYGAREASNASGMVNVDNILTWIEAKGIQPSYGTQRQFAFAIARAIGENGQPLRGGLKRPFNAAQKKARRKIDKIWADAVARTLTRASRGR